MAIRPDVSVDADRYDPLAGFDLVPHRGDMVFRVGEELLKAGGRAVEEAVEAGFPDGTELEYDGGAWVVVLPYDGDAEPAEPAVVVDLRPAPGYEWAEHGGRQVLRLADGADPATRPALRPPRGQAGWRWRPAGELGWVLIPPAGPQQRAVPSEAAPGAPRLPAPALPVSPRPVPTAPPPPIAEPPVATPAPPDAPAPARPSPSRRGRLLDVLGIVLIAVGLAAGGVLLLNRGGGGGDDAAAALADLLGVATADLRGAVTPHDPAELATSVAPPADPQARIVGTALVQIDVDGSDAARLAGSVAGSPTADQYLVVLLELAGDAPSPGAGYRYALLDAERPLVRVPEGDDADGLARLELRRAYFYDPALDAVAVEPGLPTGAFATLEGRYVLIGVPRGELAGGTVFGHAAVSPAGDGPLGYMLSPPYQID